MKTIFNVITTAVLLIWELPQNIVGALLLFIYWLYRDITISKIDFTFVCYVRNFRGGLSLGWFTFLPISTSMYSATYKHETIGHRLQSMMLGWFYLLIIGIPSICWAGLHRLPKFKGKSYYSFYTERWADKLAGIKRR